MTDEYLPGLHGRDESSPRSGTYFDVIFGLIVLLASGFSAYTTYLGFSYDIPVALAVVLAVIIGLGLLAINFKIRDARRDATGVGRPLAAFLFVFVFSFVSNTNAIYTYFVRGEIVGQTQEEAWRVFDAETNALLKLLAELPAVEAYLGQVTALDIARENLKRQIVDPRNPGMGERAGRHLVDIRQILGVPLTSLRAPPRTAPMEDLAAYAERLDRLIEDQAKRKFAGDPAIPALELSAKIEKVRGLYEKETRAKQYSSKTTDLMKQDLDSFVVGVQTLVDPAYVPREQINNSADETGSFQYTWQNFLNWISPAAIVLSVLLGALLDVLAPVLSILLYRPDGIV